VGVAKFLRSAPGRLATGAFILNSGLGKWNAPPEHAKGIHQMASGAYSFLDSIPPEKFTKLLSAAEIVTGGLLLAPFVPNRIAGLALTAFSGGLVGVYGLSEGTHKPGSPLPTADGLALAKDVWMLAIGLGLVVDGS
jgi:hypothetical protein